ncbi:MAG TPA: single-stranded-DNA-specific exonuclease RecJ, partial [Nitrospirales bacterium]|nr:single-stranded-DNA-specific exonuclease RecJ [Nitrospirales bacterium]
DVDGITSTSLYVEFFRARGLDVAFQLPNRFRDGYGFNMDTITQLRDRGISLLITADCGTTSRDEVTYAASCGIDVIVTDHHEPGDDALPPALALLNPCRADSSYPFRGLCSGALAFKVALAYDQKYDGGGDGSPDDLESRDGLDLVALATIADMAPLVNENRTLVREGLKQLSTDERVGIKALKDVANVSGTCRAETIGFALAPRINAAGRMDDAAIGVRLLTTHSLEEARRIASTMDRLNDERKRTQHETELEAEGMLGPSYDGSGPVVVSGVGWHQGVVGIVAARLADRYYRPAVVIALNEDGIGRGSARSIPEFDLFRGMNQCRMHLDSFGGHQFAAGLTIRQENIPAFREAFTAIVHESMNGADVAPRVNIDAEVALSEISFGVVDELSALGPFGAENPEPILAARQVQVTSSRRVGHGHLSLKFRSRNGVTYDAIGFGMGGLLDDGTIGQGPVDAAFKVSRDSWRGTDRLRLQLLDVRQSS